LNDNDLSATDLYVLDHLVIF